jgi:iron complex outermembrane receptor protein
VPRSGGILAAASVGRFRGPGQLHLRRWARGLANVTQQYEAGLGNLAASINYKINDHIALQFDGLNLNNPRLKYYSNAEQPQAFYTNGRQFYFGVRVSL